MTVQQCWPAPELREFVRSYSYRTSEPFDWSGPEIKHLVFPARLDQFLEFYFESRAEVVSTPGLTRSYAPRSALVGTQAGGRVELFLTSKIRTFTIQFQPTGFHRLFGLPMVDLAGKAIEVSDALSTESEKFRGRLEACSDFLALTNEANRYLTVRAKAVDADYFDLGLSQAMIRLRAGQPLDLDSLVGASGVGQRQFERRFKLAVGFAPKRYLRVARLQTAISMRRSRAEWSWGRVAVEAGFHDQMHLVHEFRALGGDPPERLIRALHEEEDRIWIDHSLKSKIY